MDIEKTLEESEKLMKQSKKSADASSKFSPGEIVHTTLTAYYGLNAIYLQNKVIIELLRNYSKKSR
jgi:hypothetical protein